MNRGAIQRILSAARRSDYPEALWEALWDDLDRAHTLYEVSADLSYSRAPLRKDMVRIGDRAQELLDLLQRPTSTTPRPIPADRLAGRFPLFESALGDGAGPPSFGGLLAGLTLLASAARAEGELLDAYIDTRRPQRPDAPSPLLVLIGIDLAGLGERTLGLRNEFGRGTDDDPNAPYSVMLDYITQALTEFGVSVSVKTAAQYLSEGRALADFGYGITLNSPRLSDWSV
jgi:hypothetical protein